MSWELIGVIAELVSAVAVVVSLLYLAIQIKHTRQQATADNMHSTVDRWVRGMTDAMRTEEGADFLRHALHNYGQLSPSQIARLHTFMLDLVVPFQVIQAKHESGLIDARLWDTFREDMAAWFKSPGMLALWGEVKSTYPPYLVAEIDSAIADHKGPSLAESMPYLKPDK